MPKFQFFILKLVLVIVLFVGESVSKEKDCAVTRTIFEIGSGSTKAKKAKINTCDGKLISVFKKSSKILPIQDDIEKSSNKTMLSKKMMDKIVSIVTELEKDLDVDCNKEKCIAVGTAALREASNSRDVTEILKNKKNITTYLISQEEEGTLGYLSVLANLKDNISKENLLVLDVGGGSTQLTYNSKNLMKTVNIKIGSQTFKTMVIEFVKGYNLSDVNTPNPLTKEEVRLTKRLADKSIGQLLVSSPTVRQFLKNKDMNVIAIGNFFNKMIPYILNKSHMDTLKKSDIEAEIKKLSGQCDYYMKQKYKKVNSLYTPEILTNLILVDSTMSALSIKDIELIDIDNNDGILISEKYWN
jgi:exopolyphosphatase/pppGpp-phosphohydrolase